MDVLVSFAQEKEDIFIYHALKSFVNDEEIFYIDVGANDPLNISVTEFFYLRGGHGINIEPQVMYKTRYDCFRKKDTNLFVGVAERKGTMQLYGEGVGASMYEGNGCNYHEVNVETLEEICDKYVKDQTIHFLKIDVEGYTKNVLNGMNFNNYRPWLLCIESYMPDNPKKGYKEWESLLISAEYTFAAEIGINRYYVANEHNECEKKLKEWKNIDRYYEVFNMAYKERYEAVINSRSWKITNFLRKINEKCRF